LARSHLTRSEHDRSRALRAQSQRAELGQRAERLVAEYLQVRGFQIVGRNVRLGRLEIDLIARRGLLLVFCEVRARSHDRLLPPAATIDHKKIARLRQAAGQWLKREQAGRFDVRLDAAAVVFDTPRGRIEYYEGAY
jgi:putative endonuclease